MPSSSHATDVLDRLGHGLLVPLDVARSRVLRGLGPWVRPFVADPWLRLRWLGTLGLLATFALAIGMPGLLLALGPILLGVPHLVADARYLVVKPGLHLRPAFVPLVLLPAALAFVRPMLEVVAISLLGAALVARGTFVRRAVLATLALGVALVGRATDRSGEIVFAHLHNAIAFLVLFVAYARTAGERWSLALPTAIAAGCVLAIAAGLVPTSAASRWEALAPLGLDPALLRSALAPTDDPVVGERLVALFAFGQAAHYAVWLRFVPELARGRRAPRSFRSSFDALRADLGTPLFVVSTMLAIAFPLAALSDVASARDAYLRLALFHGPLELAVLGISFVEPRSAWTR